MEPTTNFAKALRTAYQELDTAGKLTQQDKQVVGQLLDNPVMTGPNGKEVLAMLRVHRKVRRFYLTSSHVVAVARINWEELIGWMKDHWVEIVRIILSVLPFLIA